MISYSTCLEVHDSMKATLQVRAVVQNDVLTPVVHCDGCSLSLRSKQISFHLLILVCHLVVHLLLSLPATRRCALH